MLAAAACEACEMITVIVNNTYNPTGPSRVAVTLAADATLQALHEKVAEECAVVPLTFALVKTLDGTTHRLDDAGVDATTLLEAGFTQKCKLRIEGIDGNFPTRAEASSLFMTPEFRAAVYGLGAVAETSLISRELQRLFVHLQTSKAHAVDTRALTASFGWTSADAFEQHDVQEFLRVLFDALEAEGGAQAEALRTIYRGEWCDYVQCQGCMHQSSRATAFDDATLAIRAFDAAQTPITTLEGALAAFLQPETLEGENAYACERCGSKQPARKGIRFTSLPPVLCIGLKRFDFDFAEMRRIKLHHAVKVPSMLDASLLLDVDAAARHEQARLASEPYELFSLLLHAGSALAGHYFAFIKELSSGRWYKFNDSHVTAATDEQLKAAMGASESGGGGAAGSTYMALYRRVSHTQGHVPPAHLPAELSETILAEPASGGGLGSAGVGVASATEQSTPMPDVPTGAAPSGTGTGTGTDDTEAAATGVSEEAARSTGLIGPLPRSAATEAADAVASTCAKIAAPSIAPSASGGGTSAVGERGVVIGRRR